MLSGVYGWLWNDADLDAVWDTEESALQGWTVFLDADKDGQLDVGETSTTTDANGYYVFGGLSAGELPDAREGDQPYVDVNGDGIASALDALLVINYINSQPTDAAAEGEAAGWADAGVSASEASLPDSINHAVDRQNDRSPSSTASESWGTGQPPLPQTSARSSLARTNATAEADEAAKDSDWEDVLAEIARDVSGQVVFLPSDDSS